MEKEKELYHSIENYSFGDIHQIRADYINGTRAMGSYMTRDTQALSGGKVIPSHITTMAGVHAANIVIENIDKFLGLIDRFIRQLNKKMAGTTEKEKYGQRPVSGLLIEAAGSIKNSGEILADKDQIISMKSLGNVEHSGKIKFVSDPKKPGFFERITNNQTFAIVIGGLILLIILYEIYVHFGINLSQFSK